MADTNFTDTQTVIYADWLQAVNNQLYRASGTTANRPAGVPNGYLYLDTTLSAYGTPIFASSLSPTGWVNYNGAAV